MDYLYRLFGKIWVEEEIPEDWRHGHPFQVPKERQFERLQKLEGHHVTVNTRKSVQQDSSGKNENRGSQTIAGGTASFRKERSCTDSMQDKVTSLYEFAAKLGLKINKKKTRTMRANHVNKNSIQLMDEDIEDEDQFTYLGSVVSRESGTDRDIKSRIEPQQRLRP